MRTMTFTMEDALISAAGFMILSGAGLTEASTNAPIKVHTTEQLQLTSENYAAGVITLSEDPYDETVESGGAYSEDYIYVMKLDDNGDAISEPLIATRKGEKQIKIEDRARGGTNRDYDADATGSVTLSLGDTILVDYYVAHEGNVQQIDITPDKFGGNYYLEASTLFRDTNGVDMPAEFIVPNCKIQSNFTFTMASSGDPSTFTFTMDAFPDYTRFNKSKKVLAAIQIITDGSGAGTELVRRETDHDPSHVTANKDDIVTDDRKQVAPNT